MQLFYNALITSESKQFVFDKEESKHIIKVLRKKENDILHVTNGLGYLFTTQIWLASETKCTVTVLSSEKVATPKYQLHLAVAPTKMNERYEWFLEKATEIGVSEITPIICDHSERKIIKMDRFEKIVLAAMKQSNQMLLPKLNTPILLKDFLIKDFDGQKLIAHCEETSKKSLKDQVKPKTNCIVLIGPEGDFSEKEINLAVQNKFIPISLGSTRLRTETAAIVACHSVSFINEN